MSERYRDGMKVRRKVLGDAHVNRAESSKTEFDQPFQDCLLYTSPSPRDATLSRMPSSA